MRTARPPVFTGRADRALISAHADWSRAFAMISNGGLEAGWNRPLVMFAVLALIAAAGCLGIEDTVEETDLEAASLEQRSLDTPPDLRVGEWWTFELEERITKRTSQTTLVVTDRTDDTATIGMAADTFQHGFLLMHLPPLGVIELDTFSWNLMYDRFDAAVFPLEPGQTWTTEFHGVEMDAEVVEVEDSQAHIEMLGANERVEATYDAEVGMLTSFDNDVYDVGFEVVDHGLGYEDEVKQFTDISLGFFEGRIAAAVDASLGPAPPVQTVEVDQDVSHATLGLMGGKLFADEETGTYRAVATAPDGTTFEETFTISPADPAMVIEYFGHDAVQGTWELEFEAAGPGYAAAELIVYNLDEITLSNTGSSEEAGG